MTRGHSDAPFEGKTVAQASFTGQRADPVRPVSRDAVPLQSQKFLGTTEFQKAFPRHPVRWMDGWMDGCGWSCMVMDGHGWLWMVTSGVMGFEGDMTVWRVPVRLMQRVRCDR